MVTVEVVAYGNFRGCVQDRNLTPVPRSRPPDDERPDPVCAPEKDD